MSDYLTVCGEFKLYIPKRDCGEAFFLGVEDATIEQGTDFDLRAGVTAYSGGGQEIPFTVTPSEVDSCEVGTQRFVYTARGVTAVREITVTEIADPTITAPTEAITVDVGVEFDPMIGVSAVDGHGNPIPVTADAVTNYIHYPWYETTKTENGITFTDNGDGTITITGTSTGIATFYLNRYPSETILHEGSFVLKGTGSADVEIGLTSSGSPPEYISTTVNDYEFDRDSDPDGLELTSEIQILEGVTVNATFRPAVYDKE